MIYEYDVYASSVHKDRTENGQEIDTLSDRRLSWSIIRDILYERLFLKKRSSDTIAGWMSSISKVGFSFCSFLRFAS